MSLRGNGLECPVGLVPGDDVADKAGEPLMLGDEFRVNLRLMLSLALSGDSVSLALIPEDTLALAAGEAVGGCILITPAAIELSTGTKTTPDPT